jgi:hypothetical protein
MCDTVDEYRYVTDFPGSCDQWAAQGQPTQNTALLYCGNSFVYNFAAAACTTCLSQRCPGASAQCAKVGSECDDLLRCLRACTAGTAIDACIAQYPDAQASANAYAMCGSNQCRDSCT